VKRHQNRRSAVGSNTALGSVVVGSGNVGAILFMFLIHIEIIHSKLTEYIRSGSHASELGCK